MSEPQWGPSGRHVFERTYQRTKADGTKETWAETVERVVSGNLGLVHGPKEAWSAEITSEHDELYDLVYNFKILPAGRQLWASGTKKAYLYNCFTSFWTRRLSDHFEFTFLRLMEGGGVGANYGTKYLNQYGPIRRALKVHIVCDPAHPDFDKIQQSGWLSKEFSHEWSGAFPVEDSREGWAMALVDLIDTFMTDAEVKHEDRVYDVSRVRAEGAPLRTFGGSASGPEPLAKLLTLTGRVLSEGAGALLTPLDAMTIDHEIGACVVAGGNRRSARMAMVPWDDPYVFDFISCKTDTGLHWTTNISVEVDDRFLAALDNGDQHAANVLDAITDGMLTNGEPGIWNSSLSNVGEPNQVYTTNPCVSERTWIPTTDGPRQVKSLVGRPFTTVLDGKPFDSDGRGFYRTGRKDLYLVRTSEGYTLECTSNQELYLMSGKRIKVGDLTPGDRLQLVDQAGAYWDGPGSAAEGYALGFLVGDGTFDPEGRAILGSWPGQGNEPCEAYLYETFSMLPGRSDWMGWQRAVKHLRMSKSGFTKLAAEHGIVRGNKTITPFIEQGSSAFQASFLRAYFDTDGHVEGSKRSGFSVRLSSIDKGALEATQRMLQRFGIRSSIRSLKDAVLKKMPGGTYACKASYRLIVSGRSCVERYANVIGFLNEKKAARLADVLAGYTGDAYSLNTSAKFVSAELIGAEDVYDCTIPGPLDFDGNGLRVRDCGEIALEGFEACNLGHINMDAFAPKAKGGRVDRVNMLRAHRLMTRFLIRATYGEITDPKQRLVMDRNRRIGLGHFGVQGLLAKMGIRFSEAPQSTAVTNLLEDCYDAVRSEARSYAFKLRIPEPVKVTTVAPTGCQSPETVVVTGDGVLELGEIVDENGGQWQPLDSLTPQEWGFEKITQGYVNGIANTLKIQLHSGVALEATPQHRYRVLDGGNYVWRRVDEIRLGDKVVCKIGGYIASHEAELDTTPYVHFRINGSQPRKITSPDRMSPALAWWLGIYYSDGSTHNVGVRLHIESWKSALIDKVVSTTKSLFNIECRVIKDPRERMVSIYVSSKALLHYLRINDLRKGPSYEVAIPLAVRTSSKASIQSFVQGFLDGDGSQTRNTRYIDTTSPTMARHLHACLRATGQNVRVRKDEERKNSLGSRALYRVYFIGHGSEDFPDVKLGKVRKSVRRDLEMLKDFGDGLVADEVVGICSSRNMTLDLSAPVNNTYIAGSAISHNTVAKLAGRTEGIHPVYARHFIRRMRFSSVDPDQIKRVRQFQIDGFKVEPCQYAANTWVVEFPTEESLVAEVQALGLDAAHLVESADELTLEQMLEFQAMYQKYYADNALSFTVNIPDGSLPKEHLIKTLRRYLPRLKGTTIMPDGTRPQAPYERITEAQYLEMTGPKVVADSVDEDCGGACPVR